MTFELWQLGVATSGGLVLGAMTVLLISRSRNRKWWDMYVDSVNWKADMIAARKFERAARYLERTAAGLAAEAGVAGTNNYKPALAAGQLFAQRAAMHVRGMAYGCGGEPDGDY